MKIIDFHNHYYPPRYLEALRSGDSDVRFTVDDEGNPVLHYPGDYNVAVRGHRDIDYRSEVLAGVGVDMQVLTFTSPGTHVETPARAARLARGVNDAFAEIIATRGGRFTALATLPLNDPVASVAELERASGELGLPGAMLFSNVNGVALSVSGGPNDFSLSAALSEGDNMLSLMATDLAGNPNRIDLLLCLDTGFPLLEVIAPDFSRAFDHGNLTVVLRSEPGALVSVGNTTVTALSAIVEVPVELEDGRTVLLISAADRAGNTVRKSEIVNIDSRFPTLEVRGGTSQATANATFRLNGQTEPNAFVRVGDFEGQADSLGVFAVTLRLRPGANTVRVTSWDAAGNTVSTTVDIAVLEPPGTAPAGFAAPELAGVALLIMGAAAAALAVPTVRFILRRRG